MDNQEIIAKSLIETGAMKLNFENPFKWSSGWNSPIYCDNRVLLSFPEIRKLITISFCENINKSYNNVEVIAGVATGAIAWGVLVAEKLNLPFVYVRPEPKKHGMGNQIEGFLPENKKVVVIEDLVSTGGSSLKAIEALNLKNAQILSLISIFNYGFENAKENFKNLNIPIENLTNLEALIKISNLDPQTLISLENWRKEPQTWTK